MALALPLGMGARGSQEGTTCTDDTLTLWISIQVPVIPYGLGFFITGMAFRLKDHRLDAADKKKNHTRKRLVEK